MSHLHSIAFNVEDIDKQSATDALSLLPSVSCDPADALAPSATPCGEHFATEGSPDVFLDVTALRTLASTSHNGLKVVQDMLCYHRRSLAVHPQPSMYGPPPPTQLPQILAISSNTPCGDSAAMLNATSSSGNFSSRKHGSNIENMPSWALPPSSNFDIVCFSDAEFASDQFYFDNYSESSECSNSAYIAWSKQTSDTSWWMSKTSYKRSKLSLIVWLPGPSWIG